MNCLFLSEKLWLLCALGSHLRQQLLSYLIFLLPQNLVKRDQYKRHCMDEWLNRKLKTKRNLPIISPNF